MDVSLCRDSCSGPSIYQEQFEGNIVHIFPLQSGQGPNFGTGSNLLNYYFNYSISFEQYNQRTLPKMQYLDLEQIFLLNI